MRYLFRAVSIPSGEVAKVTRDVVVDCLRHRDPSSLSDAISLADELGMRKVKPILKSISDDPLVPATIRKQALEVLELQQ